MEEGSKEVRNERRKEGRKGRKASKKEVGKGNGERK